MVQKHSARRLHYDFRLEWGGVLLSWAIPRGPSLDPAEKRMAVMVESHPLEYADFEGVIPEGNYGAGPVIVWDRGVWIAVEDPDAGLESGKLLFDLVGHKLRGRWALVRTKRSASDWLLIKHEDGFSGAGRELPEHSVLSALDIDELAACRRGDQVSAALAELGAPRRSIDVDAFRPMLCETRERAFDADGWLFELKLDGFRLLGGIDDGRPFLRYRRGHDSTALYPEIDLALRSMPYRNLVLDGEVVVLDASGRPDFGRLQARAMLARSRDIARAALTHPALFMAFDLIGFDGRDLRGLPLLERKRLLRLLVADTGVLRYVDHVPERGVAMYASVEKLGLEGVVGKRADSPYRHGRSADWVKIRSMRVDDFAVIGWTPPSSEGRTGFSGLHLAMKDGSGWVYCGKVGGGFGERELEDIYQVLASSPPARYDFEVAEARTSRWVEPRLVCSVRYKEFTHGGSRLRQPVFLRLRDDKEPDECELPRRGESELPAAAPAAPPPPERSVALSNLAKVFWPAERYTKGDLIAYYREVADWLMPYLNDRPLVLTRYPDGIEGKSFYQKDAPQWTPEWIRTESVWSESSEREIHYFVCDDVESLTYVVNSGAIPLHVWSSRASDLARPDWCILDLDPKEAPFSDVVAVALAIRRLCDEIELPTAVKTSGSTGLHILVPLGRQCTYEQSRTLAGLIVRLIESENHAIATTARVIGAREGKVYLDWLQNRHGQLLVAPLSVRPLPGAPVSMPLRWSEVNARLDHQRFTMKSARRRLDKLGTDPVRLVLEEVPDLVGALQRLDERMRGGAPRRAARRKKATPRKVR